MDERTQNDEIRETYKKLPQAEREIAAALLAALANFTIAISRASDCKERSGRK